ncbi:MAG TPA: DUF3344 domain-containing protein [Anaerolineales bacterium]
MVLKKHLKWLKWLAVILVLAIALTPFSRAESSPLDGDNTLARSFRTVLQGGVVSDGVGLSGVGEGDITIEEIPAQANVSKAFLYWATIGSANTFTSPTLDGISVNGELIGVSGDTCWGLQNNFVYRADVTSLVSGNDIYTIAGLPDGPRIGGNNDSQGASLVVVYSDPSEPFRTVIINDGAVTLDIENQNEYTDTIAGFNSDDPVSDADVTYLIADGQSQFVNGNVRFNGTSIAEDVFNGVDGDYWGTLTFDVSGLEPQSPSTTTINNNDPDNPDSPDCLLWAATVFSVTSEAALVENDLSRFQTFSLSGDVTSAGVGLRGSGSGAITLTGIPANGTVNKAFLYWATLGTSPTFTAPTLNGEEAEGELIGASADTCWGADANFVYRAEVTSLVDGNGTYNLAGLPDGTDPNTEEASQGASLVVVYAQPTDTTFRTIIINDGAATLDLDVHSFTDTFSGFETSDPLLDAHVTYIVGDGQSRWQNGDVTFNGTEIAHNVFNGVDGDFWGTLTFDVTALSPTDPSTTTINNQQLDEQDTPDCLLWAATVFSVTPPQPEFDVQLYLPLVFR